MKHLLFKENTANTYELAILIKESALKEKELRSNYVTPLISLGLAENSIIAFNLKTNEVGAAPVKFIKGYLTNLLQALQQLNTTMILVADSAYFKVLTGMKKSEPFNGYALPCVIKGYEHMEVVLTVNYQALFYNPDLQTKVTMALTTVANTLNGTHVILGSNIIHSEYYPDTYSDIQHALQKLHNYPTLTCDIETFSLQFWKAGIGTVAFAWDQHNGIAFSVMHTYTGIVSQIKELLRNFFESYKGTIIWHNANYDSKIFIYELWMNDLQDWKGLLVGLNVMTRSFHDTKIISYLAINSCAGNDLKLKNLAHEFAGNYAVEEINDIKLINISTLLRYNLTDCLSTWYVFNKYYPVMIADNQQNIYETLMLPSVKLLLQTELNGMPINMIKVAEAKKLFLSIQTKELSNIYQSNLIKEFNLQLQKEAMIEKNLLLKVKVKPLEDFKHIVFNPSSNPMLQKLLHESLGLEITDTTDTGQPATGNKILNKHIFKLMNEFAITEEELL